LAPTLDHFYQTLKAVTYKCQLSGVDPLKGHTAAILAKNVRRRGSGGQTGSRNMAATHFLDSATPTSYSTPNTLRGLSRTVTEVPRGAVTIAPLLRPPATRKYSKSRRRCCQLRAHIARNGAEQALESPSARDDGPGPRYRTAGTVLEDDMAARNRTSGFTEPEVV